jgi:mannose-6-phosphate isomerase
MSATISRPRTGFADRGGRRAALDEVEEDGKARSASSRCWPHTEALKAPTEEAARGKFECSAAIAPILTRLRGVYCRDELRGGWVDHVDADDRPISKTIPASTLYRVYFGITSVDDRARASARSPTP